jgi:hypothetical protein
MDYGLKSDGRKHSGSGYLFSFEANKTESDQVRFFLQVNIDRGGRVCLDSLKQFLSDTLFSIYKNVY